MKLPVTLGHENVGEVVAFGPRCQGRQGRRPPCWHIPGSAAALAVPAGGAMKISAAPCAASGCSRNGGYADYLMVPHPRYLFDIGDLPPERAAPLACSGVTTFGALKKIPTLTSEPTVIIGAGGSG